MQRKTSIEASAPLSGMWMILRSHTKKLDCSREKKNIVSLKLEYGKVGEMTMRREKKHDYLGMTLDFSKGEAFIVDIEEYLKKILKDLPEDMNGTATTPAADHLFKMRDNAPKLNEEQAEFFHRVVAQLLFVVQRGRPDL